MVYASYERTAWGVAWLRTPDLWISETPFSTHSGGKCANHSVTILPSNELQSAERYYIDLYFIEFSAIFFCF